MNYKRPLIHDLARDIYEREPVTCGGFEATFEDAPTHVRSTCYDEARGALQVLRGRAEVTI